MTTVHPKVQRALQELALDLKLAQGAGQSEETTKRLILRTVEAYDARLKAAGYAQDGLTKLATDADMLTKGHKAVQNAVEETVKATLAPLFDRIKKVEQMASPGGPATRTPQIRKSAEPTLAERYARMAETTSDPDLRRGYLALARKHAEGTK